MINIVGVKFRSANKIYYFDPDGLQITSDTDVIVETSRGIEYGTVVKENTNVEERNLVAPLKKVLRIATEADRKSDELNVQKAAEAAGRFLQKVSAHRLEMTLVNAEYTFDNSCLIFYYTAAERVDFRELLKDLISTFRTRIELRQIRNRKKSKAFGETWRCKKLGYYR